MRIYTLTAPKYINTDVYLPASKSISNRALLLDTLSGGHARLDHLSDSDDTRVMQQAFRLVMEAGEPIIIDVGGSGTAMRFLTAYLAQTPGHWVITGNARIKERPIALLVDALRQAGAEISYGEKALYPPLLIHGRKLKGGRVLLDSTVSSQYISALLMVAPCMNDGLTLELLGESVISQPYIDMTLCLMQHFGVVSHRADRQIVVPKQKYLPAQLTIESDWSAASYWYQIMAFSSKGSMVRLKGLTRESLQGDAHLASLFESLGVRTCYEDDAVVLYKEEITIPTAWDYDFSDIPDLAQTLVVTCCLLGVCFHFTGLQSLRIKETDRIEALLRELRKLGYSLTASNDTLSWQGERDKPCIDPLISTYDDHRMAMAFAPACLLMKQIKIENPEVVSKSYPRYWDDLQAAGFIIKEL